MRRLRFEVEVLLPADSQLAVDTQRARFEGRDVAIDDAERLGQKAAGLDGLFDRQDRRQRLRIRAVTRAAPRCAASSVSPSTQATGWRWNITSAGNSGSS